MLVEVVEAETEEDALEGLEEPSVSMERREAVTGGCRVLSERKSILSRVLELLALFVRKGSTLFDRSLRRNLDASPSFDFVGAGDGEGSRCSGLSGVD